MQGLAQLLPGSEGEAGGESASLLSPEATFLEEVLDAIPEAVAIAGGARVLHVNAQFCRLFGYDREACLGQDLDELVTPEGCLHESEMLLHALNDHGRIEIETVRRTSAGVLVDVALLAARLKLASHAEGLFMMYRDIGRQKREVARLQHTALHDGLTGLPNRALFLDRVRLTLARLRRRPDRGFAVLFLDLDGFKQVNDTMGHSAGDALLMEIGRRLRQCVRPQDTVSRFGGDEFVLLLDETGSGTEAVEVAGRIGAEVRRPVKLGSGEASVEASVGIVIATGAYADAEAILRDADLGMYAAKQGGKGRCVLWGQG